MNEIDPKRACSADDALALLILASKLEGDVHAEMPEARQQVHHRLFRHCYDIVLLLRSRHLRMRCGWLNADRSLSKPFGFPSALSAHVRDCTILGRECCLAFRKPISANESKRHPAAVCPEDIGQVTISSPAVEDEPRMLPATTSNQRSNIDVGL